LLLLAAQGRVVEQLRGGASLRCQFPTIGDPEMRGKRLRPAPSRLFRYSSHSAPKGSLVSRRLAVESLEDRRVLAAVSWDGGGDGINWSDGLNWSTNALPGSGDDVTINVVGTITVTHASGIDTIRSLTSAENLSITGGTLTVTTGASSVNGTFNLTNTGQVGVNGAGASFVANSTTTLTGGHLFAGAGGQLNLPNASTYAETPFGNTTFQATGAGSKIDLTSVTSITGTNGSLNVQALAGGTIELDGLTSTTAHDLNLSVDGASSVLKLDALTSASDSSFISNLTIANGGTLTAPVLSTYSGGMITVNNQSVTLASLTNVDASSLITGVAGILTLPNVTSYAEAAFANTYFQANGAGSKLDLTAITSITGTTGSLSVQPTAGGTIELDGLISTAAHDINFTVDGAGNVLKLDALTSATDVTFTSNLTIANGGTLTAPVLATYGGGTITVNNQSVTFTSLTNVNGSSLIAGVAGILTLPNVTSYAEGPFANTYFQANGAGSKLDLTAITSITGTNGTLNIQPTLGGTIELDGLPSTTAHDINFTVDGAGNVLKLDALTSFIDTTLTSNLTVGNGATLTAPVLATYSGGTITVNNQSVTFSAMTNVNASSLIAGPAGIITLPNVASYAEGAFANTYFQANGAGSKLDLTAITSITGTTGTLNIQATLGGTIELDGLPSTSAHDINFTVDGAGNVLKLDILTSVIDTTLASNLTVGNGATLTAPVLATYSGGTITVNNQSVTFSALTNVNASSLIAGAAGILTLPNVTSYAEGAFANTYFQANGAGSKLDLTALTSITGTTGTLNVQPTVGGTIELDGLVSTTAHDINFVVDGAGNVLKLNVLTNVTDTTLASNLTVGNGATLTAPVLATYSGGTITVNNQSVTFSALTNVNASSLIANSAGVLTLTNVTSYAEAPFANTYFRADGAGSKVDLTPLTSISGTNGVLNVQAFNGGLVEIDGLPGSTANGVILVADGASSLVLATALASMSDANSQSNILANNSGTVQLKGSGTIPLSGVDVVVNGGSVTAGTLVINSNSKVRGTGTINANITNNNLVSPGNTGPGKLTINGSYTQSGSGNYTVELNGLTPQTQFDQIAASGAVSLGGTLSISRTYLPAIGESFKIIDKTSPGAVSGTFLNSPEGDIYTVNGIPLQLSYVGGDGNDVTLTRVANLVVDRKLFYDQSVFDGNVAGPSGSDDNAIAPDKTAYRPNNTLAVFSSVSSYSRGINGIMVDFSGPHGTITANDLVFKIGNDNSPGSWLSAPANSGFTVRTAAGYRGADRIEITWASNSIRNQWLEVQVLANGTTNAVTTDVHFWGNKVGDTGAATPGSQFLTSATDKTSVVNNQVGGVPITNTRDFNRDGNVTAADATTVVNNQGTIERLLIGPGGPFAPEGDSGIASSLAASASGASSAPSAAAVDHRPAADLATSTLAASDSALTGQFAGEFDLSLLAAAVADEDLDLGDELISSLLAD